MRGSQLGSSALAEFETRISIQVWNLQGGIDAWSVEVDRSWPGY